MHKNKLKYHPAANLFPMLDTQRLQDLAGDIAAVGQRVPIQLFRGMILDGRNRYEACLLAGVEPRFEPVPVDVDPWAYVWSLNGERRDLTMEQRYLIWKRVNIESEAWQATRDGIKESESKSKAKAKVGNKNATKGEDKKNKSATSSGTIVSKKHITSEAKAKASKTNRGAVERMDHLDKKRPDLAEKVLTGEMPAATAIREMKRAEVVANLESIEAKEAKAIAGVYDVVVQDVHEATDLIMLKGGSKSIAIRFRNYDYFDKYHYEFTIRGSPRSVQDSEFKKIINGFADIYFYAFVSEKEGIKKWVMLDLDCFRWCWINRFVHNASLINYDDRCNLNTDQKKFTPFDITSFHDGILIATNYHIPFEKNKERQSIWKEKVIEWERCHD